MSARRRWIAAAAALALLLGIATFPMRLALALSGADDAGISARTVRGSIWAGELVEARLGALPLGTVEASLSPLALLGGRTELAFARADERLGALSGRLHGGGERGLSDVNGTALFAGGLGAIPVDTVGFEGAAVRFDRAGKCVAASGRIALSVAAPIAGLDLSRGLAGPLSCAGGRAQAALSSQSGMERLTISFGADGAYRAQLAIDAGGDPAMASALAAMGFKAGSGGFMLATSGRF
ncbi:type II secretion system protein N [Sphingopyxis sp. XHP0097]|uniref:Type II secretion system protein N n=1 Tax=Sphingopyxis jiangsuensis TaxID=2871171 RepID=A0ABS7MG26_9SPHN|nr:MULTISPECIES: type II secretion system protein N [Sphingopyxis]MBL0768919.1 type II secretion system protein N [Sphingopyxis lutea]MBY4637975.1 type II secretion system protein N [Sphingopyxis jiangsuensis]